MDISHLFTELINTTELRKVEFKSDQYRLDNNSSKSKFVKDILCMANAPGDDGYILLGVKSEKGKPREIVGISHHHDSSDLEAIVNGVIEEPIQFEYYPLSHQGKDFALLYIPASRARPHWPKKDYGVLRKHVFYTRRASGNREASIQEIRGMCIETIRISDIAQRKAKMLPHIVDELVDMSLDDRKSAMYKMLKNIASKVNLREHRSIMSNFFNRREQEFALVRSSSQSASREFSIFMYPWTVKRDEIIWSRRKVLTFLAGSRTMKITPPLRTRLEQSSLIHVSYKRIYTTSLEKWPYSSFGYRFANEWSESWGRVMKWEDSILEKAKYEFFLPNVTSKAELKDRIENLLAWVDNHAT